MTDRPDDADGFRIVYPTHFSSGRFNFGLVELRRQKAVGYTILQGPRRHLLAWLQVEEVKIQIARFDQQMKPLSQLLDDLAAGRKKIG